MFSAPSMIAIQDLVHLKKQVDLAIAAFGPACDLNHLDISQMTSLDAVFRDTHFTGNISRWDTSRIISMEHMFEGTSFNGDISHWDTSNVYSMGGMFKNSKFNGDISKWNVSRLQNTKEMFECSVFNGDLAAWDTSEIQVMGRMFAGSQFTGNISAWCLTELLYATQMFEDATFFGDLSMWEFLPGLFIDGMFSPNFCGVLPSLKPSLKTSLKPSNFNAKRHYARMLGSSENVHSYLSRMPFNMVHAALLMSDNFLDVSDWMLAPDFSWATEQCRLLSGMECTHMEVKMLLVDAMTNRRNGYVPQLYALPELDLS